MSELPTTCPCGSGTDYAACCEPVIQGKKSPSPEAVMRARYTSFVLPDIKFLGESLHPSNRSDYDEDAVKKWAEEAQWMGLEIVDASENGNKGNVEFIASFKQDGVTRKHHELAEFRKVEDKWFFWDGKMADVKQIKREAPKVGRNDPCSCGSGKKYKKCCGK